MLGASTMPSFFIGQSAADALLECCQSESLSEDALHVIFQRHGLEPNKNHCVNYNFFHAACRNKRITEGIIRCLLEYFPDAASATGKKGWSPLHYACNNENVTLNIIQLIVDAAPDSVRSLSNNGSTSLHKLCGISEGDHVSALKILKWLIEKYPEAVRHANSSGFLPIHFASKRKSLEFCRVLIEAYPGSEQIANAKGVLPLHMACWKGSLATVKYLYYLYPDGILHVDTADVYPIHHAIGGTIDRDFPATAVDIVKFLLDCDPDVKLQTFRERSLLHYSCRRTYDYSNIAAALEIAKTIYDVHPEAIEDTVIARNIHRYHQQVQSFIESELVYARKAKDHSLMTTPDDNGQLPLHVALHNNVTLGSIKLLIEANPQAVQSPDNSGALPLHIACQRHDSTDVIQYLLELDTTTLDALDMEGNTVLHYACRGAKYETIAMLLEKYDAVSVSKQNAQNKLPIDYLWESNEVSDRESIEYTESVFRLFQAHPETIMNYNPQDQVKAGACSSQNGKKRKLDAV